MGLQFKDAMLCLRMWTFFSAISEIFLGGNYKVMLGLGSPEGIIRYRLDFPGKPMGKDFL